jgi:hypothetical protein
MSVCWHHGYKDTMMQAPSCGKRWWTANIILQLLIYSVVMIGLVPLYGKA